jgi:hypothetical protein
MCVDSAFALTPAAIITDANVCRASCSTIRPSPACFHAFVARLVTLPGANGETALRPNTSPSSRSSSERIRCSTR